MLKTLQDTVWFGEFSLFTLRPKHMVSISASAGSQGPAGDGIAPALLNGHRPSPRLPRCKQRGSHFSKNMKTLQPSAKHTAWHRQKITKGKSLFNSTLIRKGSQRTWRRGKHKESPWKIIICCLLDHCWTEIMALSCWFQPDEPLVMWPCCLFSVIHVFPAVAHTGSQSRVSSGQHLGSCSPGCSRNTISFRYTLYFYLQVGFSFAFSWAVHYDKPQHLILNCVYC